MQADELLNRLGFGAGSDSRGDPRFAWVLIYALLLIYVVGFVAFYPSVATNTDEAEYIRQAILVPQGTMTVERVDPLTGDAEERFIGTYPMGTPLAMSPLVRLVGWRGAFVVPALGLLGAVLLLGRWIHDAGRPPIFALLILGFPPALVLGRVAMSDVPSAAVTALGLWLFWRGQDTGGRWWLAAGFVAGASYLFRTSNPLVFVPLFAGTVLRRDGRSWALVAGGLAGVSLRFLTMHLFFGDALFERDLYRTALDTIGERLPLFLAGLVVFVPGGLVLASLYRGRRRPEIVVTFYLFFLFYLFQEYSTITTGSVKRLVLALRYFIPLLPLMIFAMAESAPRLWRRLLDGRGERARLRLGRAAAWVLSAWLVAIGLAAFAVHPVFSSWSAGQAAIRDEIDRTVPEDAVIVTNWYATRKFLDPLASRFTPVHRGIIEPAAVSDLARRYPMVFVVMLDRSDSDFWLANREQNRVFVDALGVDHTVQVDQRITPTQHLRIWRIESP